jgi:hypothetical protein
MVSFNIGLHNSSLYISDIHCFFGRLTKRKKAVSNEENLSLNLSISQHINCLDLMSNSATDHPQQCCTFHAWGISHFTIINNLDNTHIVFVINAQGFRANICTEK